MVDLEFDDGLAVITIDRPHARNAISLETMDQLEKALDGADGARALVLTGAGDRAFVSGGDLKELSALRTEHEAASMAFRMRTICDRIAGFPTPTIAALNGHALGGGCELALACDFRIMARGRPKIGVPEVKLGLLPSGGGTTRLPRLIGRTAALDLLLRGRPIGADDAERIGLITEATEPEDLHRRASGLAAELASLPPLAVREIKRCVDLGLDGPLSAGFALEERGNIALAQTADAREGVAAFNERRPPRFIGA